MTTVLFGTVEYYEIEITEQLARHKGKQTSKEDLPSKVFAVLEHEIQKASLFDEQVRVKYLQNLILAFGRLPARILDPAVPANV